MPEGEHPDNQCPQRGPALSHIMDSLNNTVCRFCRVRLDPSKRVTRPVESEDEEVVATVPAGKDARLDTPLPPAPHPFLDVCLDDRPVVIPAIRFLAHPLDELALHVPGMGLMAHTHVLDEDKPVEWKNKMARHIARWHFQKPDREPRR